MDKRSIGEEEELPKVGYCSPPVNTRFKKGQSGNPSGKPKGSSATAIEKIARKKVTVTEGGKRRKVPVMEALILQLFNAALAGNDRARRDALNILQEHVKNLQHAEASLDSGSHSIIFMKDSTELLLALGICIDIEGRCVIASWAIEAARERQKWVSLSPEHEKLLQEFGEVDFTRRAA